MAEELEDHRVFDDDEIHSPLSADENGDSSEAPPIEMPRFPHVIPPETGSEESSTIGDEALPLNALSSKLPVECTTQVVADSENRENTPGGDGEGEGGGEEGQSYADVDEEREHARTERERRVNRLSSLASIPRRDSNGLLLKRSEPATPESEEQAPAGIKDTDWEMQDALDSADEDAHISDDLNSGADPAIPPEGGRDPRKQSVYDLQRKYNMARRDSQAVTINEIDQLFDDEDKKEKEGHGSYLRKKQTPNTISKPSVPSRLGRSS
eukprot:comp63740_c0_seq1/m.47960 comp63740_c0_seq1/g.47960  ORF comp63740_c0_seq1/g.47960 comp63740_c0_seq1/m.47960 type:complete len:268 (-) comp63740_c0_seq1:38-841(-)